MLDLTINKDDALRTWLEKALNIGCVVEIK